MRAARAALILICEGDVALIERHSDGRDYWVFPGGGVDPGETPEVAALREAREELGLEVVVVREVLELHEQWFGREVQHFFLAETRQRRFGDMTGPELREMTLTNRYGRQWVPVGRAVELELLPVPAKELLAAVAAGRAWPAQVEVVTTSAESP